MLTICRGKHYDTEKIDTAHHEIPYDEDYEDVCPICIRELRIRQLESEIEDARKQGWKEGYERGMQVTQSKVLEKLEAMKDVDIRPIKEMLGQ